MVKHDNSDTIFIMLIDTADRQFMKIACSTHALPTTCLEILIPLGLAK